MNERKKVLILCTGNSARSQMAEGLLRSMAGGRFEVMSAGVAPTKIKVEAVTAMNEIGVDISQQRSKSLDEYLNESFDYVITVCDNAKQQCPIFPGRAERIHWEISDPAEVEEESERLAAFRVARDELQRRLKEFVRLVQ